MSRIQAHGRETLRYKGCVDVALRIGKQSRQRCRLHKCPKPVAFKSRREFKLELQSSRLSSAEVVVLRVRPGFKDRRQRLRGGSPCITLVRPVEPGHHEIKGPNDIAFGPAVWTYQGSYPVVEIEVKLIKGKEIRNR